MPRQSLPIKERFEQFVSPEPMSGCWLWTGSVGGPGYGQLSRNRTLGPITAHRLSYELHVGPVGDRHVLHHCDVRSCCNPAHLYLGSDVENARDRKERGTARGKSRPGELSPSAKLTAEQVIDIKSKRLKGVEFARLYGVTKHAISKIQTGKNWGHINAS